MTTDELDAKSSTAGAGDPEAPGKEATKPANSEAAVPSSEDEVSSEGEAVLALQAEVSALQEQLAQAEQQASEYLSGWQRAQASFENFRKRTSAEQEHWRSAANAALLTRLLPILDDFKRAFEVVPKTIADDPWLNGIRLVRRKVQAILETESVAEIASEPGDPFDPNVHEAVLYQEVDGFDEGQIVAVVETGYTLAKRVLRPTVVVVAKGREGTDLAEVKPETPTEADAELTEEEATIGGKDVSAETGDAGGEDIES